MTRTKAPARPGLPRWLWPTVKVLLICAVVGAVGWVFYRTLTTPELWQRPWHLRPAWLAVAAALYLLSLAFPALYWYCLLRALGQQPTLVAALRAYYVGQMGRYVPGKVVGVWWRAGLLAGPGVRQGVAVLVVTYEALTTIAAGVLLALALFALWPPPGHRALGWRALALLGLVGVLLMPGVFNRLAERATRRFRDADAPGLPSVRAATLAIGLLLTACGWVVQGGVLWAVVESLVPGAWAAPVEEWARCSGYVALAYAAGFLVLAAPGGLGVRDFLIQHFLAADLGRALGAEEAAGVAVVAALVLRLLWLVSEVAAAGVCYWLPAPRTPREKPPLPA